MTFLVLLPRLLTISVHLQISVQYLKDHRGGLHYNWHRFYDPETGRYISADPIGLAGGINLYRYANTNPINWVDRDGMTPAGSVIGGTIGSVIGGWGGSVVGGLTGGASGGLVGSTVGPAGTVFGAGAGGTAGATWGGGIGAAGGGLLGAWLGDQISDWLSDSPQMSSDKDYADKENWDWWQENVGPTDPNPDEECSEEDRCEKVRNMCSAQCVLMLGGRDLQASEFRKCLNDCMEENECSVSGLPPF